MDSRELVGHIRSGPAELDVWSPLRFRRRTRLNGSFNPCDFDVLLQALQWSETIQDIRCGRQQTLGITEEEWAFRVEVTGRIRGIKNLTFSCSAGSREFCPFQTVADALNNARSLRKLEINLRERGGNFPEDSSGLTAFTNALREHTVLREFTWVDYFPWLQAAPVDLSPDLILRSLPACPQLR
mgnify:CR=1 FL=1